VAEHQVQMVGTLQQQNQQEGCTGMTLSSKGVLERWRDALLAISPFSPATFLNLQPGGVVL